MQKMYLQKIPIIMDYMVIENSTQIKTSILQSWAILQKNCSEQEIGKTRQEDKPCKQ